MKPMHPLTVKAIMGVVRNYVVDLRSHEPDYRKTEFIFRIDFDCVINIDALMISFGGTPYQDQVYPLDVGYVLGEPYCDYLIKAISNEEYPWNIEGDENDDDVHINDEIYDIPDKDEYNDGFPI